MIGSQKENSNSFNRIKPWEAFKFNQEHTLGLLGLLSQQEIDSVQTVYFTQEEYKDENKSEYTGTVGDLVRDDQIADR